MQREDILKFVGRRVRENISSRGMKIRDFSHKCEIDESHLYQIMAGKVNITAITLQKIAIALDVELKELLS